ncbi:MAG: RND transporter [Desulfuromonas sp.]|nr:MAG: RND transporter [Desulfuromonas sp.]
MSRTLKIFLTLITGLGLTACAAVGPDYQAPESTLPASWLNRDSAPAMSGASPQSAELSQWWQNFNDPQLTSLIDEALQANLNLRDARLRLIEARLRRANATADQLPSLTGSASASRSRASNDSGGATSSAYSAGFDASWEIDLFGGIRRGVEAAQADLEASAANLNDIQVSLAAEVAGSYIEIRGLQLRLAIARANFASQQETLQLSEWNNSAGLSDGLEVAQARSSLEQTRAQIPSLERSLAEAEYSLDILLAKAPGTSSGRLTDTGRLPELSAGLAVGIPAEVLQRRPDIRAAERTLAAETARLGVAEAARYPSLKLSGSIGLDALTLGALGDINAASGSLLAGLTAPLFDGGQLRNAAKLQDAVREQALVAYEHAVLTALQDVENALVALRRGNERTTALAAATSAVQQADEMAKQRYAAGLIDFQTVLDNERSRLSSEDSLASARVDQLLALVSLYKALGGGWEPRTNLISDTKETP